MKKLFLLLVLLCACSARAQLGEGSITTPTLLLSADPTGACPNGRFAVNILANTLFYCAGSVWNQATGTISGGIINPASLPPFDTGTDGTDFNIVVEPSNVIFNLPDAQCTIRGVVNNVAQVWCGNKTLIGDTVLDGDVYVTGYFSTDHPIEITIADTCVASEANVALLCVNPDDNKLYFSADGGAPTELGAGGTTTVVLGNGLVSGGGVTWTGNLGFTVSAANYFIAGNEYNSVQTDITLDAADGINPRIDVFAVDDTETVVKITGTAATPPSKPSVDPTTQLEIGFAYVDTGAAIPSNFTNVNIYLENTEWTCTASANFNCASTSNPYAGTKDIEATTAVATNNVTLVKPAAGTENLATYANVSFRIRSKASWPNAKGLTFTWLNGTTQVGLPVVMKSGDYSFSSSNTSTYQLVVLPVSLFNTGNNLVTTLKATVSGGGASIGFYIDNVLLQAAADGAQTSSVRFADNIVPTGAINGANQTYVLPQVPNPSTSLHCFGNGLRFKPTADYTLSLATITTVGTFQTNDTGLVCDYRF